MASPTEKKVIDEIEFVTGKRVFPYIALAGPLMRVIAAAYEMRDRGEAFYVGPRCPPEIQRKAGRRSTLDGRRPTPASAEAAAPRRSRGRRRLPPAPAPARRGRRRSRDRARPVAMGGTPAAGPSRPRRTSDPDAASARRAARRRAARRRRRRHGPHGRRRRAERRRLRRRRSRALGDGRAARATPRRSAPTRRQAPSSSSTTRTTSASCVRRVLEERGYRVHRGGPRARGARAAQGAAARPRSILDAMLPEVHGFDIARRIKGSERYGHIPIVMISAVYRGWRFAEDLKAELRRRRLPREAVQDLRRSCAAVEAALSEQRRRASNVEQHLRRGREEARRRASRPTRRATSTTAIEHLREGTRIDPLAYRLHFHLGLLYGKQGQVYDAIQELADGARHQPPALPRAEEPGRALPEGRLPQQGHRDVGARARAWRRTTRPASRSRSTSLGSSERRAASIAAGDAVAGGDTVCVSPAARAS